MAIGTSTKKEKRTLVEEGTKFKGTLESTCPVLVRGRVEGELETPSLTVSATGAVHGKAKVGKVQSDGELCGEFDADVVELSGTVKDNTVIRAKSLEAKISMQQGKMQVVFADCEQPTLAPNVEQTEQFAPSESKTGNGQSRPPPARSEPPRHSEPPPAL